VNVACSVLIFTWLFNPVFMCSWYICHGYEWLLLIYIENSSVDSYGHSLQRICGKDGRPVTVLLSTKYKSKFYYSLSWWVCYKFIAVLCV
jgi:hypothetical protein